MTDIQAMFNMILDMARRERSSHHLTLGKLIGELKNADESTIVEVVKENGDRCSMIEKPDSYRGYYADLAFSAHMGSAQTTVSALLKMCESALGETYTGYKGGEFIMNEDAPLWVAQYGSCGEAMMRVSKNGGVFEIHCQDVDA